VRRRKRPCSAVNQGDLQDRIAIGLRLYANHLARDTVLEQYPVATGSLVGAQSLRGPSLSVAPCFGSVERLGIAGKQSGNTKDSSQKD
jgi:hypothetical protein